MRRLPAIVIVGCVVAPPARADDRLGPTPPIIIRGKSIGDVMDQMDRQQALVDLGALEATGVPRDLAFDTLDARRGQLEACYLRGVKARAQLPERARLTLSLGADGRVTSTSVPGLAPVVTACIAARAKTWRFARPASVPASVTVELVLAGSATTPSRDAALPAVESPVVVRYGAASVRGGLDARRVRGLLQAQARPHGDCFAAADLNAPLSSGPRVVTLDVDAAGAVTSSTVTNAEPLLAACLHDRLRVLSLPPADRAPASVTIEVSFTRKRAK